MRCHAVTGTAWEGPQYCGHKAAGEDANGRPCCKRHMGRQLGIEWRGERGRYPYGTDGKWQWRHGEPLT